MSKLFKYYGVKIAKGEVLFREGDKSQALYMIHKGSVRISRNVNGKEEEFRIINDGEFFGEMGIIDAQPRSATAIAHEDCELIRMPEAVFEENFERNPQFGIALLKFLSRRLRDTNQKVVDLLKANRALFISEQIAQAELKSEKTDRSGKWRLIDYLTFVNEVATCSKYTKREVKMALNDFDKNKKIRLIQSKNNKLWIGIEKPIIELSEKEE